jgi:hypothetical protein
MEQLSVEQLDKFVSIVVDNSVAEDKWFVCSHLSTEAQMCDRLSLAKLPKTVRVSQGHYGNVDGKNHWNDCNKFLLMGLPYRKPHHTANLLLGIREIEDREDYMSKDSTRKLRDVLHRKAVTADVIQAINRVRCRRTVDVEGNCLPVEGYLTLPRDKTGEDILSAIREEMPDVVIIEHHDWSLTDTKRGRTVRGPDVKIANALRRTAKSNAAQSYNLEAILRDARIKLDRKELAHVAKKMINRNTYLWRVFTLELGGIVRNEGTTRNPIRTVVFGLHPETRAALLASEHATTM